MSRPVVAIVGVSLYHNETIGMIILISQIITASAFTTISNLCRAALTYISITDNIYD